VVLLYRRHPQSRTARMRAALQERNMRSLIREMHPDLYEGRLPVGCCGSKKRSTTNTLPIPNRAVQRMAAPLAGDLPGGQVWAQYNGNMTASFFVKGQATGARYEIFGKGFKFPIWVQDAAYFASMGRGKHFTVGVTPPPQEKAPEPVVEQVQVQPESEFQAPEPELAVIERLDPVGAQTRGQPVPDDDTFQGPDTGLAELDMEIAAIKDDPRTPLQMKRMLTVEGWHLESLANADVEELVPYPGIGKVTAAKAIAEANALWSG